MRAPTPDEFLRRLRALYCRHRQIDYRQYDANPPTLAELIELVEVLAGEVNSAFGLHDFLYREEAIARKQARDRLAVIQTEIAKIQKLACGRKEILERYKGRLKELAAESKALKAAAGVDTG
jgi:hypothetical protein